MSESPPHHHVAIKRERDRDHHHAPEYERERDLSYPPEKKRTPSTPVRHQGVPPPPPPPPQLDSSLEEQRATPTHHENGADYSKPSKCKNNGHSGSDQMSPVPILNGMQFKISSRGKVTPPLSRLSKIDS